MKTKTPAAKPRIRAPKSEEAEWVAGKLLERNPRLFDQGHAHSLKPSDLTHVLLTVWYYSHVV